MVPLIIGEVLFDEFSEGRKTLGGAPFNVAWHLQGMGEKPLFLSAVGNDPLGETIRERMTFWSMRTDGLQVSEKYPTGRVRVREGVAGPAYEILNWQAYDQVDRIATNSKDFGQKVSLLYHGTLAWRNPQTRDTIRTYREELSCPRFVDLNIRDPWFDQRWLPEILSGLDWLKLNTDELALITDQKVCDQESMHTAARSLRDNYHCKNVFVTDGAKGAFCFVETGEAHTVPTPKVDDIVDTVGAGDAFSAAAIQGVLHGKSYRQILSQAVRFAAGICQIRGATSTSYHLYRESI